MDGEYKADRALSEAERLVNVRYLGHCLHENRSVWNSWTMGWSSRCRDCKVEIQIDGYMQLRRLPDDVLAHAWSQEHVKTAASPVNGAQLRYALEREGWRVQFLGVDGRTACEVRKGSTCWRTPFFDTQAEAVVEAGAMTLRNYTFNACAKPRSLVQSPH